MVKKTGEPVHQKKNSREEHEDHEENSFKKKCVLSRHISEQSAKKDAYEKEQKDVDNLRAQAPPPSVAGDSDDLLQDFLAEG